MKSKLMKLILREHGYSVKNRKPCPCKSPTGKERYWLKRAKMLLSLVDTYGGEHVLEGHPRYSINVWWISIKSSSYAED